MTIDGGVGKTVTQPPIASNLQFAIDTIEAEREHLLQVQAMARCLYEVLLYSDDDDGAMHADVAQVIARLVRETVSRLETIGATFGKNAACVSVEAPHRR